MPEIPTISDAERKVMKLLWRKAPQPAYDLAETLCAEEPWHPRTVKSLLNRLVHKRALGTKPYKNLYLYYPLVSEADCLKVESESFLKKMFEGSLSLMLVSYARHKKLSKMEIAELRKLIEEQEK